MTYQEVETGGTDFGVLGLSLLMIFLILAAQYERWTLPLAVISAVPFAVFGAILGNWLVGLSNDIYTQVAIITLLSVYLEEDFLVDVALVYALLSFLTVVVLSRMVTFRQKRRKLKSGERSERHGT